MLEIREMEMEDLEPTAALEEELFQTPWSLNGLFSFFLREDVTFLVALDGEKQIGYCGIVTVLDEGDIVKVAVSKEYQGQGVGTALMKELFRRMSKRGIRTIHLEVRESNHSAIALYRKMGFSEDGIRRDYYESPVENALLMSRKQEERERNA